MRAALDEPVRRVLRADVPHGVDEVPVGHEPAAVDVGQVRDLRGAVAPLVPRRAGGAALRPRRGTMWNSANQYKKVTRGSCKS